MTDFADIIGTGLSAVDIGALPDTPSGVTAGTYTGANVTVDSRGRVTAATATSAPVQNKRTAGVIAFTATTWTALDTATDITLAAQTGDWLQISIGAFWNAGSAVYARSDVATIVSAATVNYISTRTATPATWGVAPWLGQVGDAPVGGAVLYQVQAGDISGGNVVLRVFSQLSAAGTRNLDASAADPFWFWAKNMSR